MPDGTIQKDYTYRPAVRDKTAPLIMIAGPPGTGKTFSALRLARGIAGPEGKIFLADTDNGRALFYADEFKFQHLNLHEPFRPEIFEKAANEAQRQKADVFIIDNFMHEHTGLLDWHEEVNLAMARGDAARLESTKVLAWAKVKPAHKHMRERLYQLNMAVIMCCGAEPKLAMVKQTEGKDKGKTIPVDQGLVAICGKDIPWNMTVAVMLPDPKRPGVPVLIKALPPLLIPVISLDRPLNEATGAAIGAWARGGKPASAGIGEPGSEAGKAGSPPGPSNPTAAADPIPPHDDVPPPSGDDPPPEKPPPSGEDPGPGDDMNQNQQDEREQRIEAGAKALGGRFLSTSSRADHNAIVDDPEVQKQIAYLQKNRKELFALHVKPFVSASWIRTDPDNKQGSLTP